MNRSSQHIVGAGQHNLGYLEGADLASARNTYTRGIAGGNTGNSGFGMGFNSFRGSDKALTAGQREGMGKTAMGYHENANGNWQRAGQVHNQRQQVIGRYGGANGGAVGRYLPHVSPGQDNTGIGNAVNPFNPIVDKAPDNGTNVSQVGNHITDVIGGGTFNPVVGNNITPSFGGGAQAGTPLPATGTGTTAHMSSSFGHPSKPTTNGVTSAFGHQAVAPKVQPITVQVGANAKVGGKLSDGSVFMGRILRNGKYLPLIKSPGGGTMIHPQYQRFG